MLSFESVAELDFKEVAVIVEVTYYQPFRNNSVGHIDNWLPDDEEEIEISVKFEGTEVNDKIESADLKRLTKKALDLIKGD